MDAEKKNQRRQAFADKIGGAGGFYYRRAGLVSMERAMKVYDACLEVYEQRKDLTRAEFRRAVNARLCEAYGFDPWTLLLIVRLIALFIEMWFTLERK